MLAMLQICHKLRLMSPMLSDGEFEIRSKQWT